MTNPPKPIGKDWKLAFDERMIDRSISRMSLEIVERDPDLQRLAIVGIKTGGEYVGRRLRDRIFEQEKVEVPFGMVDITLYRDDVPVSDSFPMLRGTDLPFRISGSRIVLVDDVLFTGRTVRGALDAITDFGRPSRVELAVLVDRGHRELPIRPDYVGRTLQTQPTESVRLRMREMGYAEDGVYLVNRTKSKG